jgi:RNA polymerase sigma factor (sigma-70 family)
MAAATLTSVLQQLRTIASARAYEERSDPELLKLFLTQREEAAFVALVKRHGPMVLHVCRRIQGNEHDAEDVFQATFLLLARKAGSISKPESLASWLHGVAHRLALEAKVQGSRRQTYERQAADMRSTSDDSQENWRDLQETLDAALRQVPEKYRLPLLLCYLQGKTQEEAARQLGCPLGTVRSRLARGRERLKEVLERQGVCLSAGALVAGLAGSAASASVPPLLLHATTRAALAYAGGKTAAALVSARAAALVEAGLKTMLTAKVKIITMVVLAVGTLGLGASGLTTHLVAGLPPKAEQAKEATPPPKARPGDDAIRQAASQALAGEKDGNELTIRGRVLDIDGKPLGGARLLLFGPTGKPVDLGRSAADGQFTVDVSKDLKGHYLLA